MLTFGLISEELKDYLLGDRAINKIFTLGNSEFPVSWENEIKLWTFLETRAALLLKTYKTTSQVSLLEFDVMLNVVIGRVSRVQDGSDELDCTKVRPNKSVHSSSEWLQSNNQMCDCWTDDSRKLRKL